MNLVRQIKAAGKKSLHGAFVVGQRAGFDILPRHFYSQIPDLAALKRSSSWRAPASMTNVCGTDIDEQLGKLQSWLEPLQADRQGPDVYRDAIGQNGSDGGYGEIEAIVLYAFVATQKPRTIVQVGCGVSTAIILAASSAVGYSPKIVCVEPYPTDFLVRSEQQGRIVLIRKPAQDVDIGTFQQVSAGDLLFIDSTHTVKVGSEVNRLILEVLPRLGADAYVHFHDIYFPYDYQRHLLSDEVFFHSESTLLHAFLACNQRFQIEVSMSMLHYAARDRLKRLLRSYDPQSDDDGLAAQGGKHFPSSIWLRCTS
jgi:hypothetical protein